MKKIKDLNITIVGLGMEGGSYALALREYIAPKNLWAIDIDSKTLKAAENLKSIDKGYLDPSKILPKSDLVILCIYPSGIIDFVKENMPYFKSGSILTDAAGVKRRIVKEISQVLREDIDYIPAHPMAGNEFRGFIHADKSIFNGNTYIITPTPKNKTENLKLIENMAKDFGCSKVIYTDIDTHDSMIAYASQLIHAVAVSIVNNDNYSDDILLFSGGSFKSATRVANINPDLWTDAFFENKDYLIKELNNVINNLAEIKESLEENKKNEIYRILLESYKRKNKHHHRFLQE